MIPSVAAATGINDTGYNQRAVRSIDYLQLAL
jgi:hypothetical protein